MKNKKIITISTIILVVVVITGCAAARYVAKKDLENAKKDLEETYEKYGTVDKESVTNLIAKFNAEIMDNGINTPAYDDYMVVEGEAYWWALTEEVNCYIKPVEFSNDKDKDIADLSVIYIAKDKYDEEIALKYTKELIKANNLELTDKEITDLLNDAKKLSNSQKMANNGKGISVGIVENSNHFEYQVRRLYK